ncbi:MAG: glycosyltransferase family 2 protein [Methanocella sp.]|jgi:glycosyltransferase involved in cell wall biosynthesis
MKTPTVSVIIPTYRRGHLLTFILEALTNQTSKDFEVLMIVKPSGDTTEEVIKEYSEKLAIKVVKQNQGYVVDALNLGLMHARGKILVFLDDDAVPLPDLISAYIMAYRTAGVGGVAGDVIPVTIKDNKLCQIKGASSEILEVNKKYYSENAFIWKLCNRPINGLDDYLFYLSKAGFVSFHFQVANRALSQPVNSLLAKGANMSILADAAKGFRFPDSWILGLTFEQYLGWYLWKKGYNVLFNSEIKAYHVHHGQSLSRNIKEAKKEALLYTEDRLLFYRLYDTERGLSLMHRLVLLAIETTIDIKSICLSKDVARISKLKNKFMAEMLGLKWLIHKKVGSRYSPRADLEKILQ